MIVVLCALLAVGAIGFTLLVREQDIPAVPAENPEIKHLEAQRQVLYENLKDLQFEYLQGKLSEEDYQSLKASFLYELAPVMDSLEKLDRGKERLFKKDVAAGVPATEKPRVAQQATLRQVLCPSCSFANPVGNRFCGQCGESLPVS